MIRVYDFISVNIVACVSRSNGELSLETSGSCIRKLPIGFLGSQLSMNGRNNGKRTYLLVRHGGSFLHSPTARKHTYGDKMMRPCNVAVARQFRLGLLDFVSGLLYLASRPSFRPGGCAFSRSLTLTTAHSPDFTSRSAGHSLLCRCLVGLYRLLSFEFASLYRLPPVSHIPRFPNDRHIVPCIAALCHHPPATMSSSNSTSKSIFAFHRRRLSITPP